MYIHVYMYVYRRGQEQNLFDCLCEFVKIIYIYIHAKTQTHTHIHTCKHKHTRAKTHKHTYMYTHTHLHHLCLWRTVPQKQSPGRYSEIHTFCQRLYTIEGAEKEKENATRCHTLPHTATQYMHRVKIHRLHSSDSTHSLHIKFSVNIYAYQYTWRIYRHTCRYINIHTGKFTYASFCINICKYMYMYINIYIHIYRYIYKQAYIYIYIYRCIYKYLDIYSYIYI